MIVNTASLIHYLLPLLLCAAGFHGVFFHGNLAKKTTSWCAFQLGLIFFLIQMEPSETPLPLGLALEVGAVTLVVTLLLAVLCLKILRRSKTLDGDSLAKRGSK